MSSEFNSLNWLLLKFSQLISSHETAKRLQVAPLANKVIENWKKLT